jgi:hypothetical protein
MKTFDPTSKTDAMADEIRRMVVSLAFEIFIQPDFLDLGINERAEVMTGGILTGLMGVLHSFVIDTSEAHDELEKFVTSYVAQARMQAEGIANGSSVQ